MSLEFTKEEIKFLKDNLHFHLLNKFSRKKTPDSLMLLYDKLNNKLRHQSEETLTYEELDFFLNYIKKMFEVIHVGSSGYKFLKELYEKIQEKQKN